MGMKIRAYEVSGLTRSAVKLPRRIFDVLSIVLLEASSEAGILDRSSQVDSIGATSESNKLFKCVEATPKSLCLSLHSTTPEQFMNQSADIFTG